MRKPIDIGKVKSINDKNLPDIEQNFYRADADYSSGRVLMTMMNKNQRILFMLAEELADIQTYDSACWLDTGSKQEWCRSM